MTEPVHGLILVTKKREPQAFNLIFAIGDFRAHRLKKARQRRYTRRKINAENHSTAHFVRECLDLVTGCGDTD